MNIRRMKLRQRFRYQTWYEWKFTLEALTWRRQLRLDRVRTLEELGDKLFVTEWRQE